MTAPTYLQPALLDLPTPQGAVSAAGHACGRHCSHPAAHHAPSCPLCGEIHSTQNTRIVGSRFAPEPHAYYALGVPDALARPTREDAVRDRCEWRQQQH